MRRCAGTRPFKRTKRRSRGRVCDDCVRQYDFCHFNWGSVCDGMGEGLWTETARYDPSSTINRLNQIYSSIYFKVSLSQNEKT